MPPWTRSAALTATVLLSLSTLAACGSDDESAQDPAGEPTAASSSPSPEETASTPTEAPTEAPTDTAGEAPPEEPALPACSEVWVVGERVPGGYGGCLDGETTVPADGRYCEFGRPLLTFGPDLWAVAGGSVNVADRPLMRDPGYRQALKQCGG